jgi:hypothetical protein
VCILWGRGTGELSRYCGGMDCHGSIPGKAIHFFLPHSALTGSGDPSVFCSMGTEGSAPRLKQPGREADHSPPSRVEVKNDGAVPVLPIQLHGVVIN